VEASAESCSCSVSRSSKLSGSSSDGSSGMEELDAKESEVDMGGGERVKRVGGRGGVECGRLAERRSEECR
jgi:hypothetical protein